jgi:ABC-type sugar transport system permease subunit
MNGSSRDWSFVGFRNFERLFGMGIFAESIGHTLVFLVGYVGLTLVLGFIIALLLNRKLRFRVSISPCSSSRGSLPTSSSASSSGCWCCPTTGC